MLFRGNETKQVRQVRSEVEEKDPVRETEKGLLRTWGGRRKTRFWTAKKLRTHRGRATLEDGNM